MEIWTLIKKWYPGEWNEPQTVCRGRPFGDRICRYLENIGAYTTIFSLLVFLNIDKTLQAAISYLFHMKLTSSVDILAHT